MKLNYISHPHYKLPNNITKINHYIQLKRIFSKITGIKFNNTILKILSFIIPIFI